MRKAFVIAALLVTGTVASSAVAQVAIPNGMPGGAQMTPQQIMMYRYLQNRTGRGVRTGYPQQVPFGTGQMNGTGMPQQQMTDPVTESDAKKKKATSEKKAEVRRKREEQNRLAKEAKAAKQKEAKGKAKAAPKGKAVSTKGASTKSKF